MLALLQTKAAECEESSDKLVTNLTSKEKTVEEFLDEFLTARKAMHLRRLKADKMLELIQQQKNAARNSGSAGGHGGMGPAPYPNSSFYGAPASGVPYPTGPYQMPMPGMPAMPGMMYRHFWNCLTRPDHRGAYRWSLNYPPHKNKIIIMLRKQRFVHSVANVASSSVSSLVNNHRDPTQCSFFFLIFIIMMTGYGIVRWRTIFFRANK